ncbi:MAG: hypothetical protein QM698_13775 [Micropepsaceae bacterium]
MRASVPLPPLRQTALFVALIWLAFVAASLLVRGTALTAWPDPDDAMRIAGVRDLMAGQSWYDLHQHRLDPALPDGGVLMHWSRLVDAPIAAIIVLLTPLLGAAAAEHAALLIWPLIPVLLLLPAAGFLGWRIAGRSGAIVAIIGAASAAFLVTVYAPGRIDHHNIQIALAVAVIAALAAEAQSLRAAILAGLFSGLGLSIGMETLPYLALGGAVIALRWAFDPAGHRALFPAYVTAFALAAAFGMAATFAPDAWLLPACDTVSPVYLGPLFAAALIAQTAALAGLNGQRARLLVVAFAGAAAVALVWLQNPVCLGGPYAAVDPRLFAEWMDHIREARSAADLIDANPVSFFGVFAVPVLGLVAVLTIGGWPARIAGLALALAVGLALWQVRTLPFAAVLGAPILAAAAARRFGSGPPALILAGLVSNPLLIVALASMLTFRLFPVTPQQIAARASTAETNCLRRSDYAPLATFPPGLVLGNIAFGPLILAETPHSVLAAPYHRNTAGILDAVAALTGTPDEAEAIVRRRGVAYLALCIGSNEMAERRAANPANLFDALKRGERIAWLEQIAVTIDGSTVVYRVLPP